MFDNTKLLFLSSLIYTFKAQDNLTLQIINFSFLRVPHPHRHHHKNWTEKVSHVFLYPFQCWQKPTKLPSMENNKVSIFLWFGINCTEAMRREIAFLAQPRFLILFLVLSIFIIFAFSASKVVCPYNPFVYILLSLWIWSGLLITWIKNVIFFVYFVCNGFWILILLLLLLIWWWMNLLWIDCVYSAIACPCIMIL